MLVLLGQAGSCNAVRKDLGILFLRVRKKRNMFSRNFGFEAATKSPSWPVLLAFLGVTLIQAGCSSSDNRVTPESEVRDPITGLTPTESKEVLAQVGNRTITLGQYAQTLQRMGKFERLRYQTPERQKQLLDEMIELELLAQEAERRGLDRDPEVQLRLQQALRDEVLEELRRSLPPPESLTEREVRDYYEAHREQFQEPERRRVLAIVLSSKNLAKKVATEAQNASGVVWGDLAKKYSLDRRGFKEGDAPEWAGDLGFVSAPQETRGENAEIPDEVREAVFRLEKLGDVSPEPVEVGGRHYIVRYGGTSPARDRSLRDADRTIRVELLRQKYLEKERELEAELQKKYPLVIDEAALDAWVKSKAKNP